MYRMILSLVMAMVLLVGCGEDSTPPEDEQVSLAPVNIQITEYKDREAFDRVTSELEARGIRTTVLVNADFATEHCERLRELDALGFEVMVFARPEPRNGESVTMSMLSYEEQKALIRGAKEAIEACLGEPVTGFRCTRFDQNEDTFRILDELGFEYNLGFVARTDRCLPGHEEDAAPYSASAHDFWAVPMYSVYHEARWRAFCDNPFRELDAADWEALLMDEVDKLTTQDDPLLVEFHPYFTGVDEGRFAAFVSFLDHAQERNTQFVTVAELVDWCVEKGKSASPCGCEE